MKNNFYLVLIPLLFASTCFADTTTTTTTTTDADGNVTTVEETTTTEASDDSYDDDHNLIGPTGATGTIRRSDRRQDRRPRR